jgi:hypothetical protein
MDITITTDKGASLLGPTLPSTNPQPNFENIQTLCHHIKRALQTLPCPQNIHLGWKRLVMSCGMYALLTPTPFCRPNDPGPAMVYTRNDPANTTPLTRTEQASIDTAFAHERHYYQLLINIKRACFIALNTNIDDAFKVSDIPTIMGWHAGMETRDILDQLSQTYGLSTLLKAIKRGYLKGCPNLKAHGVNKCLNPSPATAKGHMKRPRQGIRSTRRVPPVPSPSVVRSRIVPEVIPPIAHAHVHVMDDNDKDSEDSIHMHVPHANVIESDDDSDGNVFVFAVFADKQNGTLYSDLTGAFPFMSLEGNVCFLIVYHYETNAIMAVPIANFTNDAILKAFCQQFELLESKGHKIQLNVMDNQACTVVKKYITTKECKNMLVEPNNHRVNVLNIDATRV